MPKVLKECDVLQGYDFSERKQTTVGYITEINVFGIALAADQTCKDPSNPNNKLAVVAVLSSVNWELGPPTETLTFSGQISESNKRRVELAQNDPVRGKSR